MDLTISNIFPLSLLSSQSDTHGELKSQISVAPDLWAWFDPIRFHFHSPRLFLELKELASKVKTDRAAET